ncbi:nucleotidyltransferase family protein [Reinekea blandensis]|uniref:Nucleotidyltransferase family protein n=1 Tax=Reinekea blandensis MED297 TaxID=314283 RepID=A4BJN9_9GAMM|nr:nucleotidyltransferase family protein [Reinekea blandensis]EAR07679.1 hypothetical protein MED297_06554 [Reinekea sp. MED297] [Reinekea blandensis MED297]
MTQHRTQLLDILVTVPEIQQVLEAIEQLGIPDAFLAGGAITQCVWNHLSGNPALHKVKDFDIIYFDQNPTQSEADIEDHLTRTLSISRPVDVKNQAKVHTWYPKKFGNTIPPLTSSEDGLRMWLPCFAVGVRKHQDEWCVAAPFGLTDLFNRLVQPNRTAMSQQNYEQMTTSFKDRWPDITVVPWEAHA